MYITNFSELMRFENLQIQPLVAMGLTDLEARVYVYMLSSPPVTGYQIAKGIDRPAANIYEAIRSLQEKGALVVNQDRKRLCSAIPLDQFLSQLKRRFEDNLAHAEANIQQCLPTEDDSRIYQIRSVDQVLERCQRILESALVVTLVDSFPQILQPLIPHVQKAAKRGIEIVVKVYEPVRIKGVKTVCDPRGSLLLSVYPGDWLRIVADGRQYMLAYLTDECSKVGHAVWTASSFVSLMEHYDIWTEIHMARLVRTVETGSGPATIHRILSAHRRSGRERLTGYKTLVGNSVGYADSRGKARGQRTKTRRKGVARR